MKKHLDGQMADGSVILGTVGVHSNDEFEKASFFDHRILQNDSNTRPPGRAAPVAPPSASPRRTVAAV